MLFCKRAGLLFAAALCCLLSACLASAPASNAGGSPIRVVAAENFYGDIVRQLGGHLVSVSSLLSNPDTDPHEYQANVQTGIAVSQADLVIENGGGYDGWMEKILAAAPRSQRLLLKGFDLAPTHLPDNEHVWYSIANIAAIAQAITADLTRLDRANTAVFTANLQTFLASLQPLQQKIAALHARYQGTPVGLTETIFLYQALPIGLQVLTPGAFARAIAQGTDPPADTVIVASDQITHHQIRVLIYNQQTVTPVVTQLENLARAQGIPLVPVSETLPPGRTYQSWMLAQLTGLQTALGG
ncbi:MAG TPA: zinc ABC transporter substrate-binding protein [Ktedonobacteraceae bacterium]|jgi:zinc/manganese transport system substrate-binding protein